jgi:hypothetical protein
VRSADQRLKRGLRLLAGDAGLRCVWPSMVRRERRAVPGGVALRLAITGRSCRQLTRWADVAPREPYGALRRAIRVRVLSALKGALVALLNIGSMSTRLIVISYLRARP